jgi:hypothetical protein
MDQESIFFICASTHADTDDQVCSSNRISNRINCYGSVACLLVEAVVMMMMVLVEAAVYPENLFASPLPSAAGENMEMQCSSLASLSAYNSSHDYLGKIKDGTTFKLGEPVFLQANFTSTQDLNGIYCYYTVIIEIRNSDSLETVVLSDVQTNSGAWATNNLAIETYWKPNQKANYTILVFLQKSEDIFKTPVQTPVVSVRVHVT